ncbi:MAG: alpha/beta fold hydrolase [Hyphomicrobiaceae bacterium]
MEIAVDNRSTFASTGGRPFELGKPTIVFVHGAGMDRTVWALQTRYFAHHGYNAIAVDLPGHGRTEGPPLESVEALSEWVITLLDTLEVEASALVGHSLGSLVVFDAAARWPGRVKALALIGTSVPMPVAEFLLNAAKNNDHDAFDMVTIWGHSYDGQTGANQSPGLWMTGGAVRLLERSSPGVLYMSLRAANNYDDGLERAHRVTCPTLLLLGHRDAMTPLRAAKPLVEAIPQSRVIKVAGCGHMLMAEQPDAVLDGLIPFLRDAF